LIAFAAVGGQIVGSPGGPIPTILRRHGAQETHIHNLVRDKLLDDQLVLRIDGDLRV